VDNQVFEMIFFTKEW